MAVTDNKNERITQVLFGIMAAGFLAWSGVVWSAAIGAKDIYIRLDTTLKAITERIERLEARADRHEHADGHPTAIAEIRTLQRDVDRLNDHVEEGR